MKKLFLIALTALTLALFAGCSDSDPAAPALDPVPAAGVVISVPRQPAAP
jgi:hypothetical protein